MTHSEWKRQVHHLYLDGYGWEDIAVKMNCSVEDVRFEFRVLEAKGHMAELERERRALWEERWKA